MKTLTLIIDEKDCKQYGFNSKEVEFSKIKKIILGEFARKAMDRSLKIAKETGLSKMSMEEINAEIEKVRKGA